MPSLYLHIPFCETKCIYCDFYSIETDDLIDSFVDAIIKEIKNRSISIDRTNNLQTIFFGGGTPSLLTLRQFERIISTLHQCFTIDHDVECTIECNPGTVDREKLLGYKNLGVNRLSFGVQSFHEDDLKFLSRIHTVQQAIESIDLAHVIGFENVNIDLMFSLPHQTEKRWMFNLHRAHELETKHLSCYSLTIEEGTPLAVMVKNNSVRTASEESDAALYELTMSTLEDWGYHQYEVSNYAVKGFECNHNLSYWRHEEYFGFGPSAHSFWNNVRSWNVSSVHTYIDIMNKSFDAIVGKENLSPDKLRQEYIFLGLRSEGIDLKKFQSLFHADFVKENETHIQQYLSTGLIVKSDLIFRLTQKGYLLCDEICAALK